MCHPSTDHDRPGLATRIQPKVPARARALETSVDYVLDECFFAVGQAVGARRTLDYEAVIWLRDYYRSVFSRAMRRFGDRWREDRHQVTAVAMLMAERAVRYSGDKPSIDRESVERAAEDATRYCELHARRASRRTPGGDGDDLPRLAGYWCVPPEGGAESPDPED